MKTEKDGLGLLAHMLALGLVRPCLKGIRQTMI